MHALTLKKWVCIRRELHPAQFDGGNKIHYAKACYSMTPVEKFYFAKSLSKLDYRKGLHRIFLDVCNQMIKRFQATKAMMLML